MTKKKGQEDKAAQPLIVKKVKKGGGGHHGGAWKVAYADFVTAMMAFFLLLWLLNVTTDEQKNAIANYFDPVHPKVSQAESGAGGVLGGLSMSPEGAMTSDLQAPVPAPTPPNYSQQKKGNEDEAPQGDNQQNVALEDVADQALNAEKQRREDQRFEDAKAELEKAIADNPELSKMSENLKVDITPEGLRIQIVDQEGEPMFPSGSAQMFEKTEKLMGLVAQIISSMPNSISIRGHTDSVPYRGRGDYSNWELSADRANASRRVILDNGYSPQKIANVVGKADTDAFIKEDPSDPKNRRISIILLRQSTGESEANSVNSNDNAPKSSIVPKPAYQKTRGSVNFP
ncbi:MAG: flagellar motor protein MotB [Pseudobdellovibrionaceae bacterium]